jgi:FkbM family methyltransferase
LNPLFTGAYSIARRSGFLDTRMGQALFAAAYFQYKKRLEDPFERLIRHYPRLFRGGHILDIGANIGYCSTLFSGAVDSGYHVFAFEPEPFNVSLLKRNIAARAAAAVVPVQAAVGDREGETALKLNPHHHGDHRVAVRDTGAETIAVPLVTVDGFLSRQNAQTPVCFIKIDVQGYELAVCEGSARTLDCNPDCTVVLEYMPEALEDLGFHPQDLPAWFLSRGYCCFVVTSDGKLQPGPPADLGKRGYADLLFSKNRSI